MRLSPNSAFHSLQPPQEPGLSADAPLGGGEVGGGCGDSPERSRGRPSRRARPGPTRSPRGLPEALLMCRWCRQSTRRPTGDLGGLSVCPSAFSRRADQVPAWTSLWWSSSACESSTAPQVSHDCKVRPPTARRTVCTWKPNYVRAGQLPMGDCSIVHLPEPVSQVSAWKEKQNKKKNPTNLHY